MTNQLTGEWEKEFRKEYCDDGSWGLLDKAPFVINKKGSSYIERYMKKRDKFVISFIRNLLSRHQREVVEELRGKILKCRVDIERLSKKVNADEQIVNKFLGYNMALPIFLIY